MTAPLGNAWPMPLAPAQETLALARFHRDVTWTVTIQATPQAPAMTAEGRGKFHWTADGLWVLGDFAQDQFHDGQKVTSWSAHYVAGYDYSRRKYVAFAADSNGRAVAFSGELHGDRFTITSDGATIAGAPVQLRMIWQITGSQRLQWRNEMSVASGPWTLIEEYEMVPTDSG